MNYFWDKNQDRFICLDKVRNFEIVVKNEVSVIIWFNDTETLELGKFGTKREAEKFLHQLTVIPLGD
jgi:hypothetical protein